MKIIRNKHNKLKPHAHTAAAAKSPRRSQRRQSPHSPKPNLYEVVLVADSLAAACLRHPAVDLDRVVIGPGPEDDCFLVQITASATQILKLAAWAADMEPNVTVRSPSSLRAFVRRLIAHEPHVITLTA